MRLSSIVVLVALASCRRSRPQPAPAPVRARVVVMTPGARDAGSVAPTRGGVTPGVAAPVAGADAAVARAAVVGAALGGAAPACDAARPVPQGCIAWSVPERSAACFVGRSVRSGADGSPERQWSLSFLPSNTPPGLDPAQPGPAGDDRYGGTQEDPATEPAGAFCLLVDEALRADEYVDIAPLARTLTAGQELAWGASSIRWTQRRVTPSGENRAATYTHRVEIRWAAGQPWTLVHQVEGAPVERPRYRVFAIPGDRYAVIDAVEGHHDEGVSDLYVSASVCDRESRSCR